MTKSSEGQTAPRPGPQVAPGSGASLESALPAMSGRPVGITVVAAWWFIYAAWLVVFSVWFVVRWRSLISYSILFSGISLPFLSGVGAAVACYGTFKLRRWGRIFAIILAAGIVAYCVLSAGEWYGDPTDEAIFGSLIAIHIFIVCYMFTRRVRQAFSS